MNNIIVKTINPIKNLIKAKELLLQLNPYKGKKHIEPMLEQMHTFKSIIVLVYTKTTK